MRPLGAALALRTTQPQAIAGNLPPPQLAFCGFKDSHCFEEGHLESSVAGVIRMCTASHIPGAFVC